MNLTSGLDSSRENIEEPSLPKASTPCGGVFSRADQRLAIVQRVTEFREARVKKELDRLEEELSAEKEREKRRASTKSQGGWARV